MVVLNSEATQYTEPAHDRLIKLFATERVPHSVDFFDDTELRIRVEPNGGIYYLAMFGQAPSHGKTGAHPERIAELRALPYPVLFLSVMGDIGWMTWLVDGREPPVQVIDSGAGMKRAGWWVRDMTAVGFSPEAVARPATYRRVPFRLPLGPPAQQRQGLF